MVRATSEESAARRAQWLAELSDALDEAGQLAKALGASEGRIEAAELYARIQAARMEVQAMRLRRGSRAERDSDPEWTDNFPWKRSA